VLSVKQNISKLLLTFLLFLYIYTGFAIEVPIYDFPITAYSQNPADYLSSKEDQTLLSTEYQALRLQEFYNHYFATGIKGLSPWSAEMITTALPLMKKIEVEVLDDFNNQNKASEKKHYGENFKEHDPTWWNKIKENMDLNSLSAAEFKEENRAIAVTNTYARALPDAAPDFFNFSLPGEGFPFDNLQESAIWTGTPLYVFSLSKDKAWSLVFTPDGYFAWIKSNDLAYASPQFISQWQQTAQRKLIAVTQTEASIFNQQRQFQFTGYIGAVFPMLARNNQQTSILIPIKNQQNQAMIKIGLINTKAANIMPLIASPLNFAKILNQLKNRPYGWGGAYFFNDCSQELKSIFTPFAIWLPRNSAKQAKLNASLDLSQNNIDERLNLLKEKGHPLMTIIYINGHVMLYVGKKEFDNNQETAITYQNTWGMVPENHDKRYIIGQSLFFPLLKHYPESSDVSSQASKPIFKLVYLDELKPKVDSPQSFAEQFIK
jgi:cell wall-associated NlpC family hydrolase